MSLRYGAAPPPHSGSAGVAGTSAEPFVATLTFAESWPFVHQLQRKPSDSIRSSDMQAQLWPTTSDKTGLERPSGDVTAAIPSRLPGTCYPGGKAG
jgi:hypothetical protein